MAHPSNQFPDAVFCINTALEPLKPDGGVVYAITNIGAAATNLQVKSNFFEYRTTSDSIQNHIDPTTSELGVADTGLADSSGNATVAGYYELDNDDFTGASIITIQAGQTIYGKFSEVQIQSGITGTVLAYCTTRKQVGLEV